MRLNIWSCSFWNIRGWGVSKIVSFRRDCPSTLTWDEALFDRKVMYISLAFSRICFFPCVFLNSSHANQNKTFSSLNSFFKNSLNRLTPSGSSRRFSSDVAHSEVPFKLWRLLLGWPSLSFISDGGRFLLRRLTARLNISRGGRAAPRCPELEGAAV